MTAASLPPAVRRAHELVTGGAIGRPLSARILSTTAGYAPALPSAAVEIEAMSAIQFPSVRLLDTGGTAARTTPDQLFVLTRHENGCLLGAAANVAEAYAALARDITGNAWTVPGFEHAAQLARLIAAVTRAAQDGRRQQGRATQGA